MIEEVLKVIAYDHLSPSHNLINIFSAKNSHMVKTFQEFFDLFKFLNLEHMKAIEDEIICKIEKCKWIKFKIATTEDDFE